MNNDVLNTLWDNYNLVFFLLMLPFCITFEAQAISSILLDSVVILMFYDFFYYLAHRFWFHGNGAMRQVHAVHHVHHENMHKGNYATITLLYDKLFGTLD